MRLPTVLVLAFACSARIAAAQPAPGDAPPDAGAPVAPPVDAQPAEEPPQPPIELPPELPPPEPAPAPPVTPEPPSQRPAFVRPVSPSLLRHGFHLGLGFGVEIARDGVASYAIGGGAHLGWELYWPWFAIELAVAVEAHGDQTTMPEHGFWEAHPMAYAKLPVRGGVWELFVGYGASLPSMHAGDLAPDATYQVAEFGVEDRTTYWYSRLFARWYVPWAGDVSNPTALIGCTVGFFHLSKRHPAPE